MSPRGSLLGNAKCFYFVCFPVGQFDIWNGDWNNGWNHRWQCWSHNGRNHRWDNRLDHVWRKWSKNCLTGWNNMKWGSIANGNKTNQYEDFSHHDSYCYFEILKKTKLFWILDKIRKILTILTKFGHTVIKFKFLSISHFNLLRNYECYLADHQITYDLNTGRMPLIYDLHQWKCRWNLLIYQPQRRLKSSHNASYQLLTQYNFHCI